MGTHDSDVLMRLAKVTSAAESLWREMWSEWPDGHCAVTSLLLAPILRGAVPDHKFEVRCGTHMTAGPKPRLSWHAWIKTESGILIDPTGSQFHEMPLEEKRKSATVFLLGPGASSAFPYRWQCTLTRSVESRLRDSIEVRRMGDGYIANSKIKSDIFKHMHKEWESHG